MKPLTMTSKHEQMIREADARSTASSTTASEHDRRILLAEVDELRRLPVIATCGDCAHRRGSSYSECAHPGATGPVHVTQRDAEPPTWCPLRGTP